MHNHQEEIYKKEVNYVMSVYYFECIYTSFQHQQQPAKRVLLMFQTNIQRLSINHLPASRQTTGYEKNKKRQMSERV